VRARLFTISTSGRRQRTHCLRRDLHRVLVAGSNCTHIDGLLLLLQTRERISVQSQTRVKKASKTPFVAIVGYVVDVNFLRKSSRLSSSLVCVSRLHTMHIFNTCQVK
jgi:hypothetical protein